MKLSRIQIVFMLLMLGGRAFASASGPATVTGVVRDAEGVPQMGALVELLASGNLVVGRTFTDGNGKYSIRASVGGAFQLKATEALFLPTLRQNLQLKLGAQTVVNLTLNTLEEAIEWLPTQRRSTPDSTDDWKWTLRSVANRPILRVVDDGPLMVVTDSDEPQDHSLQTRVAVLDESDSFGASGVHEALSIKRDTASGSGYVLGADVAAEAGQSIALSGGYARSLAPGETFQTNIQYRSRSGLYSGNDSLPVSFTNATMRMMQSVSLAPSLKLDAGNDMELISWGHQAEVMHPMARISFEPNENIRLSYTVSTLPGFSKASDVESSSDAMPLIVSLPTGLAMEHGMHQAISLGRAGDATSISATLFCDELKNPILNGSGSMQAAESLGEPVAYDPASFMVRTVGQNYSSNGLKLELDQKLNRTLDASFLYVRGATLVLDSPSAPAPGAMRPAGGQLEQVRLREELPRFGTMVSVAYGVESGKDMMPLEAFDAEGDAPFLNFTVHQAIHTSRGSGPSVEALVDVRNLLAEGYRPMLSSDGATLYFVQVPRSIQAGLVFSF